MKIKAKLKNLRISPRKVRVSANMVRGCLLEEAVFRLKNSNKRANEPLRKLLESAEANAKNNFDVNLNEVVLRVAEIKVGEGMTLKRWRPRAYGRAAQILKRTSHIYVTLQTEEIDKNEENVKVAADNKNESKKEKKNIDEFKSEGKAKDSKENKVNDEMDENNENGIEKKTVDGDKDDKADGRNSKKK